MPERPSDDEIRTWHRWFAIETNNRSWALCEKAELTPAERTELLHAAHASAHHWSAIGTPVEFSRADLLLGRVHARLGHGTLAMRFATSAFDAIESRDSEPWERAFAHAVLADAAAAARDSRAHLEHYEKARAAGQALSDPEERSIFLATFDLVPSPGSPE